MVHCQAAAAYSGSPNSGRVFCSGWVFCPKCDHMRRTRPFTKAVGVLVRAGARRIHINHVYKCICIPRSSPRHYKEAGGGQLSCQPNRPLLPPPNPHSRAQRPMKRRRTRHLLHPYYSMRGEAIVEQHRLHTFEEFINTYHYRRGYFTRLISRMPRPLNDDGCRVCETNVVYVNMSHTPVE